MRGENLDTTVVVGALGFKTPQRFPVRFSGFSVCTGWLLVPGNEQKQQPG